MLFFRKTYVLCICRNRLGEAILTNTQKVWFIKNVQKYPFSCFRQVHIKILHNSKIDLTAKSLVTNSVVKTRVLCTYMYIHALYDINYKISVNRSSVPAESQTARQGVMGEFLYIHIYLTAKESRKLVTFKLIKNKICWIQEMYITYKTNCIAYS